MEAFAEIDTDQEHGSRDNELVECPECGQKLFAVEGIFHRGVFRLKCRKCKKYIRVKVIGEKD